MHTFAISFIIFLFSISPYFGTSLLSDAQALRKAYLELGTDGVRFLQSVSLREDESRIPPILMLNTIFEASESSNSMAASMMNAIVSTHSPNELDAALHLVSLAEDAGLSPDIVTFSLLSTLLLDAGAPADVWLERARKMAKKKAGSKRRRAEAAARRKVAGGREAFEKTGNFVLWENEGIAVVWKRPGQSCHGGSDKAATLEDALRSCYGNNLSTITEAAGIVHRLDKGVSGAMCVAKTDEAAAKLISAFFRRDVKKTYKSVNVGVPEQGSGDIDAPVGPSRLPAKSSYDLSEVLGGEEA